MHLYSKIHDSGVEDVEMTYDKLRSLSYVKYKSEKWDFKKQSNLGRLYLFTLLIFVRPSQETQCSLLGHRRPSRGW